MSCCVYEVQCQRGVLYVGTSHKPAERIARHFAGSGALATKLHKPIDAKVIAVLENEVEAKRVEGLLVRKYRSQKRHVYGGGFTQTIGRFVGVK